jgi:acetylornithine deacetylase/succinyl-diaminopimelate desuccinylase-like protein
MDTALRHLEQNRDRFLGLLLEYLRIPSVSAQRAHDADSRRAAEFIRTALAEAGFETGFFEGKGLPTVHGARLADPKKPALVVYGHYDVQPPDPLDLWETPPFEPALRDGEIRARGCADDKGPSLALVLAAASWLKGAGDLPLNLRFVIEGEEESGGTVVYDYVKAKRAELAEARAVAIADAPGLARGVPALCYGLRGIAALDVHLEGPGRDLHSGTYGGAVANPATALARLLATLHDARGRVAIAGFYDGAAPPDAAERARLAKLPFDERAFLSETGSPALAGEEGFTTWERRTARPTVEVNGIFGGYQGEGSKTIVPARAGAKLTCRLVPGQDPARVQDLVARHLETHAPPGVRVQVRRGHLAPAMYADPETPWARAARGALERAYGRAPALTREGGSIPVVAAFREAGLEPLLLGTYAPGEKAHSPNERYFVEDFFGAIRTGIHLFGNAPAS